MGPNILVLFRQMVATQRLTPVKEIRGKEISKESQICRCKAYHPTSQAQKFGALHSP